MESNLLFLAAFFAEVVGTVAGFGSSAIFLPFALLFLDVKPAIAFVSFFHFSGNIGRLLFFQRSIDWRIVPVFGFFSFVFAVAGALLVSLAPSALIKAIVGFGLMVYSVYCLLSPHFRIETTNLNLMLGGATSGFSSGVSGTGAAIRSAFLMSFGRPKEVYIATITAVSIASDLGRIPVYLHSGFIGPGDYALLPVLFAIALVAAYLGKRVVQKIEAAVFRKFVMIVLFIVGFVFVIDFFYKL